MFSVANKKRGHPFFRLFSSTTPCHKHDGCALCPCVRHFFGDCNKWCGQCNNVGGQCNKPWSFDFSSLCSQGKRMNGTWWGDELMSRVDVLGEWTERTLHSPLLLTLAQSEECENEQDGPAQAR